MDKTTQVGFCFIFIAVVKSTLEKQSVTTQITVTEEASFVYKVLVKVRMVIS